MSKRTDLFEAIRPFAPASRFSADHVKAIDALADNFGIAREGMALTVRGAAEVVSHEAIVREAYKDSVGVWTWSVGLTKSSGVDPMVYKDNPASVETCLQAYVNRLNAVYVPAVLKAFGTTALSEAQFAAAVSFHYNTGAIAKADWVKSYINGSVTKARHEFMNWSKPSEIIPRREAERDLFFDGKWSGDGTALLVPVAKPSYKPAFAKAVRVDVMGPLRDIMA